MKKIFLLAFLILGVSAFSQKDSDVLVTINGKNITVAEFKHVYEKNFDALQDEESKNIPKNLDLFINYKLKVEDAYDLKLDTLRSYKREIHTYKNQLMAPYLQDKAAEEKLLRETYFRLANNIKASHILVKVSQKASPKDTLEAYNKIINARNRILKGEQFEVVAREVSEDPSVKTNGGDLGYFTVFNMVFPFEDNAYKTKMGSISMPFKSRFGYHIVQPKAIKKSKGEVEVAHILVRDAVNGKKRIDSVYTMLRNGEKFKDLAAKYSNDSGSKTKGGILPKFGINRMVKPFEQAAFALENVNDFSKPFKTRFGWHILKLVKKHPVLPFEEVKENLKSQLKRSGRIQISEDAVLNKLKNKYTIIEDKQAKKILDNHSLRGIAKDSLQNTLFSINDYNVKQEKFIDYIRNRRHKPTYVLYNDFLDKEVLDYYKRNLVHTEPEFAKTLREYEEGLLIYELMQRKIWNKAATDKVGLEIFYNYNKKNYKKPLEEIKGKVMNDYQVSLEKDYIATLKRKNKINVNKKTLKKLIYNYKK